jgi:hypothetical protein
MHLHFPVLVLYHNLVPTNLDHLFLPQDVTLVHYTGGIVMTGASEQEVATTLDLLVRHLHGKGE